MNQKNCKTCTCGADSDCRCGYYALSLLSAWMQCQRYLPRDYWDHRKCAPTKLKYVHPDVLRRYLQEGPCVRCPCDSSCQVPCDQYLCWWDARVAWLKWKIEMTDKDRVCCKTHPVCYFVQNSLCMGICKLFAQQQLLKPSPLLGETYLSCAVAST